MSTQLDLERGWRKSEATTTPPAVLYLDTISATEFVRSYKRRAFEMLRVRQGARLLDVGCGTGDDVIALAGMVGPTGKVTGLDKNPTVIAEGWRRLEGKGLPAEFQLGDVHHLSFPDNSFDGCRSDRAVQHMDDPERAIAEMIRVLRPGGRIVISEPDWETLVIDSSNRSITRRVVNFMCDQMVRHGWIGRQLPRLFKQSRLVDVEVKADVFIITDLTSADRIWGLRRHAKRAQEAGVITEDEMAAWLKELEAADKAGLTFTSALGFLACGRKP